MNTEFRHFEHKNVSLLLIRPYHNRHYTYVESKVILWMAILEDPKNWRGYLSAIKCSDGTYELLTGTHRSEAARRLGWTTIPLEIGEYSEVEAQNIYATDNSLEFAPTAGMAIGSAPGAVKIYEENGFTASEARDKVRKSLGLEKDIELNSLLEMHAALEAGTLTEKIRDVLDVLAAIAFWKSLVKWKKDFGEAVAVFQQEEILSEADPRDIRRDLPRTISDARKAKLLKDPVSVVHTPKLKRQVSLQEKLTDLSNWLAELATEAESDETVDSTILDAIEQNYKALMLQFHDEEGVEEDNG